MKGKKQIEEVFSDKLRNLEVKVDPSLWGGVSSRLSSFRPSPKPFPRGLALIKYIVGASIAIVAFTAYLLSADGTPSKKEEGDVVSEKKKEPLTMDAEPVKLNASLRVIKKQIKKAAEKQPYKPKRTNEVEEVKKPDMKAAVVLATETKKIEVIEPETITTVLPPNTEPLAVLETKEKKLYKIEGLPNVFTPNNDGSNDRLIISSTGLNEFNITVINMQNKVVYKSNEVSFSWGGLDLHNNPAPSGRYVYYITARDREGNPINRYSQLMLIR